MDEQAEFTQKLQELLSQKQEWYNSVELPRLLEQYRLLYTCVRNLYELLTQKSIISQDPYRLDRKISDIICPETTGFNEAEKNMIIGTRFSEYDTMLDFVCTYTRFSVDNINLAKIKKLQDLGNCFLWEEMTTNSARPNTRGLATLIAEAKTNSAQMVVSMMNDHVSKCAQASGVISGILVQLAQFQRELYKGTLRNDLLEHPNFNKEKAYASAEAELAEIKRIYPSVMGKKPFYTELINEIVAEDTASNKEKLRADVLAKLQIKETTKKETKKTVDSKQTLLASLNVLGALAPTYETIYNKVAGNFELMKVTPKSFFSKLAELFKKAFNIKPKETEVLIAISDPITKVKTNKKVKANELLDDIAKKQRIYAIIACRGPEYQKIEAATPDAILSFINKQISLNQNLYNTFNALDEYFKSAVPAAQRPKVKGLKIELDSMRNTIINANKKRGEYQSIVEEAEQLKKLGIQND